MNRRILLASFLAVPAVAAAFNLLEPAQPRGFTYTPPKDAPIGTVVVMYKIAADRWVIQDSSYPCIRHIKEEPLQ